MNSYDMFQPVAIACSRLGPGPNRTVLFGFIGSLRIGAGVAGWLGSRVYDYIMWPRKDGRASSWCTSLQDKLKSRSGYLVLRLQEYVRNTI